MIHRGICYNERNVYDHLKGECLIQVKRLMLLLLSVMFVITACFQGEETVEKEPETEAKTSEEAKSDEMETTGSEKTAEKEASPETVTIKAVGDVLIHDRVYRDAETADGYNFDPMLKEVSDYLQDADITMANQETMIGGEEIGLSSYPSFNSPQEVGDALKNAGVDIVTLANNHTLDRGEAAIQSSIEYWREIDMEYTGAYRDVEDSETIRVMETEAGITIAFLSYTYGTNGIPVPAGKNYLVNLIDREKIVADIEEAKELADAIIVSYHAGVEYEPLPTQEQKDLSQLAADHGADAVIGHHPHVLQPAEWLEGKDGNQTFVIYSLGNFLSGQDEGYNQIGGIVSFDLKKTENDEVDVTNPAFAVTFVNFENETNYRVLPMYELTDEEVTDVSSRYQQTKEHMTQWLPEMEIIEDW